MTPAAGPFGTVPHAGRARPRLVCPPISPRDLQGTPASIDAGAFREVAARFADPVSTFGLELRIAYLIEALGLGSAGEDRLRRPFFRLAQEPIVWSWWDALQRVPLDPAEMSALASMLNGTPVQCRRREMFSHGGASGAHLHYETPRQARSWIADIAAADGAEGDPVKKALYRFARIVFAHPFTDANGRFARAALQGGLAREGVIATPCLALAPVFHVHPTALREASAGLVGSGGWADYFDRVGEVIGNALAWLAVSAAPQ